MRPPKGRTWGRRGRTPVVRVTAQGSKRVSIAALIATRPGTAGRARLIYRTHLDRGSGRHRRKGFTEAGYARLLDAAHQQLHGPIVLIWDLCRPRDYADMWVGVRSEALAVAGAAVVSGAARSA